MGATLTCPDADVGHPSVRRVVIVAHSSLIAEAIRVGFRKSGDFTVVGYADPRDTAAAPILRASPDAILLDDMARSERALALLRAIRAEDWGVAVFVLTMHLESEWLERAFNAGATSVISKATRPGALITLVRETLNGHIVHRPAHLQNIHRKFHAANRVSQFTHASGLVASIPEPRRVDRNLTVA